MCNRIFINLYIYDIVVGRWKEIDDQMCLAPCMPLGGTNSIDEFIESDGVQGVKHVLGASTSLFISSKLDYKLLYIYS